MGGRGPTEFCLGSFGSLCYLALSESILASGREEMARHPGTAHSAHRQLLPTAVHHSDHRHRVPRGNVARCSGSTVRSTVSLQTNLSQAHFVFSSDCRKYFWRAALDPANRNIFLSSNQLVYDDHNSLYTVQPLRNVLGVEMQVGDEPLELQFQMEQVRRAHEL